MKKVLISMLSLMLIALISGCGSSASEGFSGQASAYYWDQSSEITNITLDIIPVDDKKAVIQISSMKGSEDSETLEEKNCSLTYDLVNKSTYKNNEAGITLTLGKDGNVTLSTKNEDYSEFKGNYVPTDGTGWLNADTYIEFLRNIPAADLGDFGSKDSDNILETISDSWFHEFALYRDGESYKTFVGTDDMSAIIKVTDGKCEVIYGSMENTLGKSNSINFEGEDENEEETFFYEAPVVYPYVEGGTDLVVGATGNIVINAAWDMTESVKVTSKDESIVKVNGTSITAAGLGETALDVELVYGGCKKNFTIDVCVLENDPDTMLEDGTYHDPNLLSLLDTVTYDYTMDILNNDGFYSVDIVEKVDPGHYRHWSYFGEADPSDPNVIRLYGTCTIEGWSVEDDNVYTETIEAEDLYDSITFHEDGDSWYYTWEENNGNAGEMSIFR
jgi:hypothetical protein